jgi:hypothetical protein
MSDNFGNGVSRTLNSKDHQFSNVVWQKGKPPLDSEFSLITQMIQEIQHKFSEAHYPSGWMGDPLMCIEDYVTNKSWSNYFKFGYQYSGEKRGFPIATVNGWVIPVTATRVGNPPTAPNDTEYSNRVELDPPPSSAGDNRIDFVFLEVWKAQLSPGGTISKPTASSIYNFGNIEFGGTNLSDDIKDPAIGFETSERVQIQYCIRVVSGISLTNVNNGFDPSTVFARGTASSNTTFTYTNMYSELGDAGLWRAGDGDYANSLGAVDGYSYAIPICSVFRRNSVGYNPTSNQNGGVNRNNLAQTRDDATEFVNIPTLLNELSLNATTLTLSNITSTGIPTYSNYIRIDDEIMTYSGVQGNNLINLIRESDPPLSVSTYGSKSQTHSAGTQINLLPIRPDGLFSDEITRDDILDMRHIVSLGNIDYHSLLISNLTNLLHGELKTTWKRSGAAGIRGVKLLYVDQITSVSPAIGVTQLDAPDNHRILFSDAAILQPGNLCIMFPPSSVGDEYSSRSTFDLNPSTCFATLHATSGGSVWSGGTGDDSLRIPISPFKTGFLTGHSDSVRFVLPTEVSDSVVIYVDGDTTKYTADGGYFTVTGSVNGASTDPSDDLIITLDHSTFPNVSSNIYIFFALQYSPGRGLSRKPDDVYNIRFTSTPSDTLARYHDTLHIEPIHLWGKVNPNGYRGESVKNSEAYIDLGSKTLVVCPYRKLTLPRIKIKNGAALNGGLGLMPIGSAPKDVIDPLGLFENHSQDDLYVEIQKEWLSMPTLGDVYTPIVHTTDGSNFSQGINFFLKHTIGLHADLGNYEKNYVNTSLATSQQFFTTVTDVGVPAAYNRSVVITGDSRVASGIRLYNSNGRQGLELPPFYGVSRLWAVYEASDFIDNHGSFNSSDRTEITGNAINLLRPDFDGPTLFIIEDDDGDATFVLNAEAIDLNRLSSPPSDFLSGEYVVEASVFGFDRGFLSDNARIVLSRVRDEGVAAGDDIDAPQFIVPAPLASNTYVSVEYARTPYQGDVGGTQEGTLDVSYKSGSLTSQEIRDLIDNPLDYDNLDLAYQKSFEVLASTNFITSNGSGSLSFPISFFDGQIKVGSEDTAYWPPINGSVDNPVVHASVMDSNNYDLMKPSESNVISNLPLGSFFREKDFNGQLIESSHGKVNLAILNNYFNSHKLFMELPRSSEYLHSSQNIFGKEYTSLNGAGSWITLVDGVTDNLLDTSGFRTSHGGSAYISSRPIPGGPIDSYLGTFTFDSDFTSSFVVGKALLVRNNKEVYANETSSGDELQLVIITQAYKPVGLSGTSGEISIAISPTGTGEGYSAADRFKLSGNPLIKNHSRYQPDTSTITLAKRI